MPTISLTAGPLEAARTKGPPYLTARQTVRQVAIGWDFENVHAVLFDLRHGDGAYRRAGVVRGQLFSPVQITRAIAREVGPVVVNRAYADWAHFRDYEAELAKALVEKVSVPAQTWAKNSADISLASHASFLACEYPNITDFVVISCDGGFSGFAMELRKRQRKVIGVGIKGAKINPLWPAACNRFFYLPEPKGGNGTGQAPRRTIGSLNPLAAAAPSPPVPSSVTANYQQILVNSQIWLFEAGWRRKALVAAARRLAAGPPVCEPTRAALDSALGAALAAEGAAAPDEVKHLRCLLLSARIVRHDGSRWQLLVEPSAEALERAVALRVMEKIYEKTGAVDLAAVHGLLGGVKALVSPGLAGIKEAAILTVHQRALGGPIPCGV